MRVKPKAKNEKLIGYYNVKRWIIERGSIRRVFVSIIGQKAFVHPTKGKRAEMVDADRLFDSEQNAIAALKFKLGWMADRYDENVVAVKFHTNDQGFVMVYDRKGNGVNHYGQPLYGTKREAIQYLLKLAEEQHNNKVKDCARSSKLLARFRRQLARA